jgi:hypothetical protein
LNLIKYFAIQFVLSSVIILFGFFKDIYISKPFTYVDLLAIIIAIPILILAIKLNSKFKKGLSPIRLINKVILSILAIIIATVFIGVLTGEMTF